MSDHSSSDELSKMYDKLTKMALAGRLSAPKHKLVKLEEFSSALGESMKGFKAGKLIFDMSEI